MPVGGSGGGGGERLPEMGVIGWGRADSEGEGPIVRVRADSEGEGATVRVILRVWRMMVMVKARVNGEVVVKVMVRAIVDGDSNGS